MTQPIRILIVDDSAFIRQLLSNALSKEPDIEVIGIANDPYDAREKIRALSPDVITLDIEMPKMDGLSFLEKIMTLRPMPVIMISTLTGKNTESTIRALELGAFDVVEKPTTPTPEHLSHFLNQAAHLIRAAYAARHRIGIKHPPRSSAIKRSSTSTRGIIAIGSSTGGVESIRAILPHLPSNMPPILITQHMPASFTTSFADRLNAICALHVCEASHHLVLKPGMACIAPGGKHLRLIRKTGQYLCDVSDGPLISGHKPSVDALFTSVAETVGSEAVAAILTGMGKDGAAGMVKMRHAGARTIGQNEATCVVYGMPKAAFEAGAVEKQVPLHQIAAALVELTDQHLNSRGSA